MKKDIGFWTKEGIYVPDIQEISEVEMKESDKQTLNELVTRLDNLFGEIEELTVVSEGEFGTEYGNEDALWGSGLDELRQILYDFEKFVEELC